MNLVIVLFMSNVLYVHIAADTDPCLTTNAITEWERSSAYDDTSNMCDSFLPEDWYIVTSNAGSLMPTECIIGGFRCGTTYPFHLSKEGLIDPNEELYPSAGQTVDRIACSSKFNGDCCSEKVNIKIKNCDDKYYVYYLRPPTTCPSAFCFGENMPCPAGESSVNGFTPGCGNFPNITVDTPTVTTGIYEKEAINEFGVPYIYQTVQFQCHVNVENIYTYDVRWYINEFEIKEAAHIDVTPEEFTNTMMHQNTWDKRFKPNMMVQCSVQVRSVDFSSPGPRQYSEKFFAGVVVDQTTDKLVEGDPPIKIPVTVSIPIGCSYPKVFPEDKIKEIKKDVCAVNLLAGVPTYQTDTTLCKDGLSDDALAFKSQQCGIYFSNFDYTTPQNLEVTGAADDMINFNDRTVSLVLYSDAAKVNTDIPEIAFWLGVILPELKFVVVDKDQQTAGRVCQSNNDPHMVSFDGKPYELQRHTGEYVMYQHQRLPITIHSYYERCNSALCNCGAAVRSGNSLFVANFCGSNNIVIQNVCNKNDIFVKKQGNGYWVTVPSGAKLKIGMGVYLYAYRITQYTITASSLDFGMTKGLCGIFNNKKGDDFTMKNGLQTGSAYTFAESWRIRTDGESLFNAKTLKPIDSKADEYCTCKTNAEEFPYGEPEFACNLTTAMQPCRDASLPNSVFKGRCKVVTHERRKREAELAEDEEPEQIPLPLNETDGVEPDLSWKNGWTAEKAREHCLKAFQESNFYSVCTEHVAIIPSEEFINECVGDIQITGDVEWVKASKDNFGSACYGEARRMEVLRITNTTDGDTNVTIFDQIATATCPRNCSQNGICINGECNCTSEFFGDDCSLEKTMAPLISVTKFTRICDTSQKPCQKYIVPGIYFREGNLVCQFKQFKIFYNETLESEIVENIPGIYVGSFSMHCPAPPSRRKRSTQDEQVPLGYRLSVSNDGLNFTDEVTLLVYSRLCFECNITTLICSELTTCPSNEVPVVVVVAPDKSSVNLIVGLCVGVASVAIVVILSVMIKKHYKKKSTISCSNGNSQDKMSSG